MCRRQHLWVFIASLFLLVLASCQLIAPYDQVTDEQVTTLQQQTEQFFVNLEKTLGTPEASYDHWQTTYDQFRIEIHMLNMRVQAVPNNDLTIKEVAILQTQFDDLATLHQKGITPFDMPLIEDSFNRVYNALIKLELAKRNMRMY